MPLNWTRVLGLGVALWIISVALLAITEAVTLVPTVILLGSFVVPVAAVIFYVEHDVSPTLQPRTVIDSFILGGLLGVFGAITLEALFLQSAPVQLLGVGLVEELAKLVGLVVIAWRLPRYTTRDGVVLGAAVGFGFGALESSGYAFAAMLTQGGLSIPELVQTEVIRGVLAPVGHGLWTGIVGGTLFRAAGRGNHLRLSWSVLGAYLLVAVLHSLWDAVDLLAFIATFVLTATPAQRFAFETHRLARLRPTEFQMITYFALYGSGLAALAAAGVVWLRRVWQRGGPTLPHPDSVSSVQPPTGPAMA